MSAALPPRAVVFDWDNTLVDTWQTIHEALVLTFEAMGHPPWSLEETKSRVRHSLRDSFPHVFGDAWEEAKGVYLRSFEAIHLERLAPLPGAGALVEALDRAGRTMALVSNKTGRLLRAEVAALGWSDRFHRVVGAGDATADKPHRAPVDLALEGSGIPAGETVWFVGDTEVDVECARNAGCIPVLVHGAPPPVAECRHFADFAGLARVLLP